MAQIPSVTTGTMGGGGGMLPSLGRLLWKWAMLPVVPGPELALVPLAKDPEPGDVDDALWFAIGAGLMPAPVWSKVPSLPAWLFLYYGVVEPARVDRWPESSDSQAWFNNPSYYDGGEMWIGPGTVFYVR